MSKTIFISRRLDETSPLRKELLQLGIEVMDIPLVETEAISLEQPLPKTSWTFFSSKNGVTHFFEQLKKVGKPTFAKATVGKQKFGAIGRGTAAELKKYASVEFVGDSNDTEVTGRQFKKVVRTSKVLFPQAEDGLRAVQKSLKPEQCVDLICYRTLYRSKPIGFPDVLVFSSPSNVQSFFKNNAIKDYQKVIAFGKSTAIALHDAGRKDVIVLQGVSDQHILKAIKKAIES